MDPYVYHNCTLPIWGMHNSVKLPTLINVHCKFHLPLHTEKFTLNNGWPLHALNRLKSSTRPFPYWPWDCQTHSSKLPLSSFENNPSLFISKLAHALHIFGRVWWFFPPPPRRVHCVGRWLLLELHLPEKQATWQQEIMGLGEQWKYFILILLQVPEHSKGSLYFSYYSISINQGTSQKYFFFFF